MSVTDGKQNVGVIDGLDAIKGLAHVCSYILLHLAYLDMNSEGESRWLNTLLVDVDRQDADVVPEGGKRYVLGMVASIEFTLRELAEKEKAERG